MSAVFDDGEKYLTEFNETTNCSNCGKPVNWKQLRNVKDFGRWVQLDFDGEPHYKSCAVSVAVREERKNKSHALL